MKKYALLSIAISCLATIAINAQSWQWACKAGGTGNDNASSMDIDKFGNSYLTGKFYDSISFDTITLFSAGKWSVYIAKYDIHGDILWAKVAAINAAISVSDINLDNSGNISIVGQYTGTAQFGTHNSTELNSIGDYDVFVSKYDNNGDLLWAHSAGGAGIDFAGGVGSDKNGNLYLTGDFHITSFPYSGSKIFLAKYDSAGNNTFLKLSRNNGNGHFGNGIKVDSIGNSYITGEFFNALVFDSSVIIDAGNIESNIFLAKFDSNGKIIWGQKAGAATGYCGSKAIVIDNSGNSYITGYFHGSIHFDTFSLSGTSGLANEVFVAKYDASGNFVWASKSGGAGSARHICLYNNTIYLGGTFSQTISFGSTTLISAGNSDIFIAEVSASGIFGWAASCGGSKNETTAGIKANADGIFLSGIYADTIHFDNSILLSSGTTNQSDVFIAKRNYFTGIREVPRINNFTIYPNPANTNVTVSSSENIENILITDLEGKIVFNTLDIKNKFCTIETKPFANGIYFLQIQGKKNGSCQKLIIQH